MPAPRGYSACISPRRRPSPDTAPTHAKAPCLYPQSGLALVEAKRRGYENAVMLDQLGNVAEFATANIMIAKGGDVHTPRSEEHTSELQSLMRTSYTVYCLKKKNHE